MIEIKKHIAEKRVYEYHPYDALLDTFEDDLTLDDMD
jgi:carboxypeptidase Taq